LCSLAGLARCLWRAPICRRFCVAITRNEESADRSAHSKSKWLVNRLTLLGEKLRPILSNVQTIFEPDPKLSINHYCWLITETHSWLNRRLVTPNEVCPLMTIQADPMSGSMR